MKKILILFSLLVANVFAFSQAHFNTVLAGSSTGTAVASAALEVRSTSKGMLTPRMSEAQMLAISSPANALLVYNTTASSFYYYDLPTTTWVQLRAVSEPANQVVFGTGIGVKSSPLFVYDTSAYLNVYDARVGMPVFSLGLDTSSGFEFSTGGNYYPRIYTEQNSNVATIYNNGETSIIDTLGQPWFICHPAVRTIGIGDMGGNYNNIKLLVDIDYSRMHAILSPSTDLFLIGDTVTPQFLAYGNLNRDGIVSLQNFGDLYNHEISTYNGYHLLQNINLKDTGLLRFSVQPKLTTTLHGQLNYGFANYKTGTTNVTNLYCARAITPGNYEVMNYIMAEYDTLTGQSRCVMDVRPDSATTGKDRQLILDANSVRLVVESATKFTVDTNGIVTFGSLDSVTAYALTPSNGSKVYCNDCSGNGITGRFISYIGGAWRRESFN